MTVNLAGVNGATESRRKNQPKVQLTRVQLYARDSVMGKLNASDLVPRDLFHYHSVKLQEMNPTQSRNDCPKATLPDSVTLPLEFSPSNH